MFCGIIGFVHSDDSFRIGVWLLNSTTESSLWILFFTIAASFYNLRKISIAPNEILYPIHCVPPGDLHVVTAALLQANSLAVMPFAATR